MKNKLPALGLFLFALLTLRADATVLIYQGSVKSVVTGNADKQKGVLKTYFILNFSVGQEQRVQLFKSNGNKLYVVTDVHSTQLVRVDGPNNSTSKDFVDAKKIVGAPLVRHSLFLKGAASIREIRDGGVTSLIPRLLTGQGREMADNGPSGLRTEEKIVLSYVTDLTIAANGAGGSLAAGLSAVKAHIEADGFQAAP